MHLEIIKQRDTYRLKIVDLNRTIKNLELDKHHFEEHCTELCKKISELEIRLNIQRSGGGTKLRKNGETMNKKPFISTVRGESAFPNLLVGKSAEHQPSTDMRCTKCSCHTQNSAVWQIELQKVQNECDSKNELIGVVNKQVNYFLYS